MGEHSPGSGVTQPCPSSRAGWGRRGPAAAGVGTTHGATGPRPGPAPRRASRASLLSALARSSSREEALRTAVNFFPGSSLKQDGPRYPALSDKDGGEG